MATLELLIHVFLHIDQYLQGWMQSYGAIIYVLLFLVIFCETGLVITPFLPGDSLIFAAGALAAVNLISLWALLLFIVAAILGNVVNYQIGRLLSDRIKKREKIRFIKTEYLDKTQGFFEKYGALTIIVTRFMPIIRTFAPFIAGVGKMPYRRFLSYNAIGGICWATLFFFFGYIFGNLPAIKDHFSFVVVAIVVISLIPAIVAFFKAHHSVSKPEQQ